LNLVRVNRKAADRAAGGHPWLFSSDITDRGEAQPGDAVGVADPKGRILGVAHYSSTSQIALRLLTSNREPIDRPFYLRRLSQAIAHRQRIVEDSTAYRLVFSEADLLPGLIVDRYDRYLVMQTLSQGMDRARDVIAHCLGELLEPAGILARNDAGVRKLEALASEIKDLSGDIPERVAI
jgi:23S rRNA (cytosine1962-C5)-methyltransferase